MDEPAAARRSVTQRGADQRRASPDRLRRQEPPVDERAGSVHVGGDVFEQLDPLGHAGRDRRPGVGVERQGERVQQAARPAEADLGAQAVPRPGLGAPQLGLAQRGQAGADRLGPVLRERTARGAEQPRPAREGSRTSAEAARSLRSRRRHAAGGCVPGPHHRRASWRSRRRSARSLRSRHRHVAGGCAPGPHHRRASWRSRRRSRSLAPLAPPPCRRGLRPRTPSPSGELALAPPVCSLAPLASQVTSLTWVGAGSGEAGGQPDWPTAAVRAGERAGSK